MKKNFYVIIAVLSFHVASTANETQYWSSVQVNNKINEDYNLLGEWINRYSVDKGAPVTRSVRLGVAYKFTQNWSYAFLVESRTTDSAANAENRFIHQFSRKWDSPDFVLGFRGRLEHREFADSSVIANRLRALLRVDAKAYSFSNFTPWASTEYYYLANTVNSRTIGSYETRHQVGLATPFSLGEVELSYLSRQTVRAALDNITKTTTESDIAQLVFKINF